LESRQNPQRRVHALLGNLPADQNLCPKRQHRKLDRILPATWILTKAQNHSQSKHLLEKNGQYHHRLCQSKNLAEKNGLSRCHDFIICASQNACGKDEKINL